jgi:hypothetical protein
MASQAATPYGYSLVATNLQGSMSASNYMGLHTLTSYNPALCQSYCDKAAGCVAFNIYFERDPTLNPNVNNCPNPASTTNIKCTLWGAPLSAGQATNVGQYRDTFQVVITGSNGTSFHTKSQTGYANISCSLQQERQPPCRPRLHRPRRTRWRHQRSKQLHGIPIFPFQPNPRLYSRYNLRSSLHIPNHIQHRTS